MVYRCIGLNTEKALIDVFKKANIEVVAIHHPLGNGEAILDTTEHDKEVRAKTIDEEPRIKAFSKIYDICDDMIHEIEWYDVLARQKFDEIKRIVFDCVEQMKEGAEK